MTHSIHAVQALNDVRPSATRELAAFGHGLSPDAIPAEVQQKAKEAIIDTVGVCIFGAGLPWGRMVIDYAQLYGAGGTGTILGTDIKVATPLAALANGVLGHAFELDNLRQPSMGVHHGSTLIPALLAVGEEVHASGNDVLAAFVAGSEVMSRIGLAADNTAEKVGFHSAGITGTYASAVAAGRLFGLTEEQMVRAFGIAGSLCGGLLAFSKAGNGGMVKRLHTGRASESGVLAARLAKSGFTGPDTILEGKFGVFEAFTRGAKMERLLDGLGTHWETLRICVKCYACHITAHTPVRLLEDLKREHGFAGGDIAEIRAATSEKALSHHDIVAPQDVATAQYSLPFCLAIAAYRDPRQPNSFLDAPHQDMAIKDLATRVRLTLNAESEQPGKAWATQLDVVLRDGRTLSAAGNGFRGAPDTPMSDAELDAKFLALSTSLSEDRSRRLLNGLQRLEDCKDVTALTAC
jgi:2-methylcitrate dehydratase PrpD